MQGLKKKEKAKYLMDYNQLYPYRYMKLTP